jgi:hypothetical protein
MEFWTNYDGSFQLKTVVAEMVDFSVPSSDYPIIMNQIFNII